MYPQLSDRIVFLFPRYVSVRTILYLFSLFFSTGSTLLVSVLLYFYTSSSSMLLLFLCFFLADIDPALCVCSFFKFRDRELYCAVDDMMLLPSSSVLPCSFFCSSSYSLHSSCLRLRESCLMRYSSFMASSFVACSFA